MYLIPDYVYMCVFGYEIRQTYIFFVCVGIYYLYIGLTTVFKIEAGDFIHTYKSTYVFNYYLNINHYICNYSAY